MHLQKLLLEIRSEAVGAETDSIAVILFWQILKNTASITCPVIELINLYFGLALRARIFFGFFVLSDSVGSFLFLD